MTMTHYKQCPLCRTTFKGASMIEVLESVLAHIENINHDVAADEAKALNEIVQDIQQAYDRRQSRITGSPSSNTMVLREPIEAFNNALTRGILAYRRGAPNDVSKHMYMYSKENMDYFKHEDTRRYITVPFE